MKNKLLLSVTTHNLVSVLTGFLGKPVSQVIAEFATAERLLKHRHDETLFQGLTLASNSCLEIRYDDLTLSYEIRNNVCQCSYLFFDDDLYAEPFREFCDNEFTQIIQDAWLLTDSDSPDVSYVLLFFTYEEARGRKEVYFRCAMNP